MPSLIGQFSKLSNLFAHAGSSGAGGIAVGAKSVFGLGTSQAAAELDAAVGVCGTPQPGSGLSIAEAFGGSSGVGTVMLGSLALYCARTGAAGAISGFTHSSGGNSSGDSSGGNSFAGSVEIGISGIAN